MANLRNSIHTEHLPGGLLKIKLFFVKVFNAIRLPALTCLFVFYYALIPT